MTAVLQLCPHDSPPFADLCRLYADALDSIDCDVTTVFLGSPEGEPSADALYLEGSDLANAKPMARSLEARVGSDFDLVLCHRYRSFKVAVAASFANDKCVAIAHEFGMFARWRRRLVPRFLARGATYAGVSPAVRDELAGVAGFAALIPNGIDMRQFESRLKSREEAQRVLGLDGDTFTVGFVGRLHYKKRPEVAVAAFREFAGKHPEARLVMVGGGTLDDDVAEDPIHLAGVVPDARYLFSAFDALLMTSTAAEAFGMVALEAMAAGVPVATARIPGPEYVLDEVGFYADDDSVSAYAQALEAAAESDRETVVAAGRARIVREFSVTALARRFDDLLVERGLRGPI